MSNIQKCHKISGKNNLGKLPKGKMRQFSKRSHTNGKLRVKIIPHHLKKYKLKSKQAIGLPWWLDSKASACQFRRHRFDPLSGKISHATEQLSWFATTSSSCAQAHKPQLLKQVCLEPVLHNKRSHYNAKSMQHKCRVTPTRGN